MSRLWPWAPLLLCLALTACPYGAPVPLGAPEAGKIDGRLLGRWVQVHEQEVGFAEFEFFAFNDHEYVVEMRSHEPYKPEEAAHYRVFSSEVGGKSFLNCRDLGEKESYNLAVYEFPAPDSVTFSFVKDDAMKPAGEVKTSKALRRFVAEHIADKGFFEPGFTFKKAEPARK
ncbi:MAG: hypothetical protein NTY77_16535 [Elusimicrobia bacterium]|nr:hypothetical protein [Elusimicrobiota bacterium]